MGSIELDRGTRWVFQRFLLCCPIVFMFTGFYRVLLGFLGFEWVRQRFDWVRMGSIELDRGTRWVFQRFLLCCPIVFMFTGFYRVLLGFLGFEWVRQRFDWVRMGSIEWDRDSVGVSKVSFVLPNQFYVHRAFEFYGFVCFFLFQTLVFFWNTR